MSDNYEISAQINADDSNFSDAITRVISGMDNFESAVSSMGDTTKQGFVDIANQFVAIDSASQIWGDDTGALADKMQVLKSEINSLISDGIDPQSKRIQDLKGAYDSLSEAQEKQIEESKRQEQENKTGIEAWGISFDKLSEKGTEVFKSFGVDLDQFSAKSGIAKSALIPMAAGVAIAGEAVKKLAEFLGECTKEFAEDETAQLKFNAALSSSSTITAGQAGKLGDLAVEMGLMSGQATSATQGQIAMLAAMGRSSDQIEILTKTAQGMANEGIGSLETNLQQLSMTYDGSIGRLGKYSSELKNLTPEQMANGEAVSILNDKYGKFAETLSGSTAVLTSNIKNQWGEVKSAIGEVVQSGLKPLEEWWLNVAKSINASVSAQRAFRDAVANKSEGKATANDEILLAQKERNKLEQDINNIRNGSFVSMNPEKAVNDLKEKITGIDKYVFDLKEQTVLEEQAAKTKTEVDKKAAEDSARQNTITKERMALEKTFSELEIETGRQVAAKAITETQASEIINNATKTEMDGLTGIIQKYGLVTGATVELRDSKTALYVKVKDEIKAADLAIEWDKKVADDYVKNLETKEAAEISTAEKKKATLEEVLAISKKYDDEELAHYKLQIGAQETEDKTKAFKTIKDKDELKKQIVVIEKYYADQITQHEDTQIDKRAKLEEGYGKVLSDLAAKRLESQLKTDSDILSGHLKTLDSKEAIDISSAGKREATLDEVLGIAKKYDDEELSLYISKTEDQRNIELAAAGVAKATPEEIKNINEKYDSQITEYKQKQLDKRAKLEEVYTKTLSDNAAKKLEQELKTNASVLSSHIALLDSKESSDVSAAERRLESLANVMDIIKGYDDEELEYFINKTNAQRDAELANASVSKASAEEVKNINEKYDSQITEYKQKQLDKRQTQKIEYSKKISEAKIKADELADSKNPWKTSGIVGTQKETVNAEGGVDKGKVSGGTEIGNLFAGMKGFVETIGGALDGIVSSVASFSSITKLLNPLQTIISSMMKVLEPFVNTLLAPLVGILNIIGSTLGKILIPILDTLSPIIQLIGDAFVWLYNNAIMPFANLVIEAGNILYNAMVSVYNWLNDLWGGEDMAAKSNDSGKLTSITGSDLAAAGTDDSSSVSSGSYDSSYLGYALGTDYSPAGSYVVGEYRPEIVTLPQGSRVSSSIGASGIGSKSNNLTFNISAGEKASAADIMRESRRTMRALNVAGVL